MKINDAIRKRILEICDQFQISVYGLAHMSDVPESTIEQFLSDDHGNIKIRVIYQICQGVGMTVAEFFSTDYFDCLIEMNSVKNENIKTAD